MQKSKIYGIDLGTTYSCIAVLDEGRPRVLLNKEGHATTPSVVYFVSEGEIVVGENAKDYAVTHADRVVQTVKLCMGNPDWKFPIDGKEYSAQEISAMILRKIIQDAEDITGEKIEDVVITVPAYFGVNEREATKQAGEIAGVNVRYVVPEPTAAAIDFGLDQTEDQVILVYDLGGGTFDATMIDIKNKAVRVICTDGDHQLGGKQWDEAVAKFFAEEFASQTGSDAESLLTDTETYAELMAAAEKCKEKLTSLQKIEQKVQHGTDRQVVTLTREKFDELTSSLLETTITKTDELCTVAKDKGYAKIDKILLVGGSTYMPQVEKRLEQWCKDTERGNLEILRRDPNQIVARGAARLGFKILAGDIDPAEVKTVAESHGMTPKDVQDAAETVVTNVTARSFGVVVIDKNDQPKLCNLITVDEVVPITRTRDFSVYENDQTGVTIRCMENRERVGPEVLIDYEEDWEVGHAQLAFARPLPKGSPVEITFSMGEDGLLTVDGRDLTTNGKVHATFKTESVMSREEVETARKRNQMMKIN